MPAAKHIDRGASKEALAVVLHGNAAATLVVGAAAAQTAAIASGGIYDIWCDVNVYVKIATTADNVTTANGYLIRAGSTVPVFVPDTYKIGAIAGGAGTLSYHKVN